ncbi:MAG TPA: hypothetical protein VLX68_01600 [Chitinivibrionales bacterium]|nr:hypothetical protein [Chitinivibrionales bacterium]
MRNKCIALFIGLCALCATAQDSTSPVRVGINVTTNALTTLNNSSYNAKGLRNTGMLGARLFVMPMLAIDGAIGFGLNTATNADTASLTPKDPGISEVSGQLGLFWKFTPASWKSYLGVMANGGIAYQKWYDAVQLKDTTRVYPAPPAKNYVTYTITEPYSVIVPFFFVGLEPGFAFDNHFSLFANFGINGIFYPDSKAIDQRSVSTNTGYITSLPLVERKDASFEMSVSSVGLGVRFLF